MRINVKILKQELKKRQNRPIQEKWGMLISDRRKQKQWSQNELAEGICSVSYLSRLENGLVNPKEEIITKLFDKLWLSWPNDQVNTWALKEITRCILYKEKIEDVSTYLQHDGFNSLLIVIGYNVYIKNYSEALKIYEWLKPYIKLLSEEEVNYLLIFLVIISFVNHHYVDSFEIVDLINQPDIADYNLELLKRIYLAKNGLLLNKIAIINSDYPDIIDDLRNCLLFGQADDLQKAFLLYYARYQSADKIKKKLDMLGTIDQRLYDYILGKAYFHNRMYEQAIKIAANYYQSDKDFWFLVIRTLNVLDDKKSIKILISQMHKFKLSEGKKLLIEIYKNKHFEDDKKYIKFLRYRLLENEIFVDEYEILAEVSYEASDAFKKNFMYKESNLVNQVILPKIKSMVFYN